MRTANRLPDASKVLAPAIANAWQTVSKKLAPLTINHYYSPKCLSHQSFQLSFKEAVAKEISQSFSYVMREEENT